MNFSVDFSQRSQQVAPVSNIYTYVWFSCWFIFQSSTDSVQYKTQLYNLCNYPEQLNSNTHSEDSHWLLFLYETIARPTQKEALLFSEIHKSFYQCSRQTHLPGVRDIYGKRTGNAQKLALDLFVGNVLFQNIKLTTFIRPWSLTTVEIIILENECVSTNQFLLCFITSTNSCKCNYTVFLATNINMVNAHKLNLIRLWSYLWDCFSTNKTMVLFAGGSNFWGFLVKITQVNGSITWWVYNVNKYLNTYHFFPR